MKKKDLVLGCRVVSVFILIMMAINWRIMFKPFKLFYYLGTEYPFVVLLVGLSLAFIFLNLVAAIGLFKTERWGFVFTYIAMAFSTLFFAVSYVPVIDYFYPPQYASTLLILVNACVFAYVIYVQMQLGIVTGKVRKRRKKKA